ncbi:hypothetical protein Hanom_Chr15g01354491 [Helianthus anomalus]
MGKYKRIFLSHLDINSNPYLSCNKTPMSLHMHITPISITNSYGTPLTLNNIHQLMT